jgi:hypothetical protein
MMPGGRQAQSFGGLARKERLEPWERAFIAMLGGSKRPITKDRKPSPEQIVSELRQEGVKEPIPWKLYFAVGMNGAMVPSNINSADQTRAIRQMGDVAGFLGVIFFNGQWRTYTRRLLLDPLAQERLDAASEFFVRHWEQWETEELNRRGQDAQNALISAQVYLDPDGKTYSMFYNFHQDQLPKPGSTRVGIVYIVDPKTAKGHYDPPGRGVPWHVRFHLEQRHNAQFAAILKDAKNRFEDAIKKMWEIQKSEIPQ